jgi:hypothetical protein
MDISVSHLNRRMALQVPPELPLGFVFIVGRIQNLRESPQQDQMLTLQLRDGQHALECRLPKTIVEETLLQEGDRVRMGGQLAFNAHSARYQLLAHDLEVLASQVNQRTVSGSPRPGLETDRQTATLAPPDLPPWVRQLAPPEIQRELGFAGHDVFEGSEIAEHGGEAANISPAFESENDVHRTEFLADLSPEMVRFLSEAIDSDEDVELTPEMLVAFGVAHKSDQTGRQARAHSERESSAGHTAEAPASYGWQVRDELDGNLPQIVAGWLANSQLYLIPLLMLLIFLIATFIFIWYQQ